MIQDPLKYIYKITKAKSDPVYFVEDVLGAEPYPSQREILQEFYTNNGEKYKRLILCAGMRSGKSVLASWIAAYEFFNLVTLKDPSERYGLGSGSRITINIVATSTDTADDAIFGQVKYTLKHNDLINEIADIDYRRDFIFCEEKNVKLQLLSSWTTTAVGRTSKLVVFDEISYFEENAGKRGAWEIYTRLSKSTDTLGIHGKVVAISSPRHPNDIIMTLIKQQEVNPDPHTLALVKPTWEMNPNMPFEQLWEAHKHNPAEFWRDYGCRPSVSTMLQFPMGIKLEGENLALLNDHKCHKYLRILAIDPAVRNDAFGIAFGYINEDGIIVIDGAYRFTREVDQPFISPREIKTYLEDIIHRYNIIAVVFDTWMYPELIEWMSEDLGLLVEQHIVKKEDYDRWKELQDEGLVKVCEYEILKKEAESLLVINDKRVDHPYSGSKDVADCVANVIWYLTHDEMPTTTIKFDPSLVRVI